MIEKKSSKFGFNQWGSKKNREFIYNGCANNCLYCGVRKTQCCWLTKREYHHWEMMEFLKNKYNEKMNNAGKRIGRTIFPTAHDIFPFNRVRCFKFIKRIANPERNVFNEMLLVSKARMGVFKYIDRDLSDLKDQILIRFTITTQNDSYTKYWEGNSPLFNERLACIKLMYEKEFNTSVSIEPFLDSTEDLLILIDKLKDYVTDTIWIGKMNRMFSEPSLKKYNLDSKRSIAEHNRIRDLVKDKNLITIINSLKNNKMIRYKNEIVKKKKMSSLIPSYQSPTIKIC